MKRQPIENAPRDGVPVLGYWNYVLNGRPWTCYEITRWDSEQAEWVDPEDDDDVFSEPTHWMPLPEPPHDP